jgi:hypothetical protein
MNFFKAHLRKWTENSHPQKEKKKKKKWELNNIAIFSRLLLISLNLFHTPII